MGVFMTDFADSGADPFSRGRGNEAYDCDFRQTFAEAVSERVGGFLDNYGLVTAVVALTANTVIQVCRI